MARTSKFEMMIGAVDKLTGPFKKIQGAFSALGDRCDALKGKLQRVGNATGFNILAAEIGNVKNRFGKLRAEGSAALGKVTGAVGKLTLAFGAAGGGALALVKATANAGDAAAKSAARAGTSIAVWQEYAHAASLSDLSEEQLAKGFRKLQDTAIKAVSGGKAQASLFKMAGIDPKNEKGEVKNAESLFLELSDKINALVSGGKNAEATNLLTGIFGDEGSSLMPMLAGGADALKEMRKEAHDLGLVFSDEDAHASEAFGDALTRVGQVFQGIGNSIGKALLPFLTKLADKFTATTKGIHGVIGSGLQEWVDSIDVDSLFSAIESGLNTLKNFWQALQKGISFIGGWGNLLKIVAGVIMTKVVIALAALSGSFVSLGAAILATPIGWIMGAIALLAGAAYLIVRKWDTIKGWWNGFWEWLGKICAAMLDNIMGFLGALNPLPYFEAAWEGVKGYWNGFWEWLGEICAAMLDNIMGFVRALNPLSWFQSAWDSVKSFFSGFSLSGEADGIVSGIAGALTSFNPLAIFQDAWSAVSGFFGGISLSDSAVKIMDTLLGGFKGAWEKTKGWLKGIGGKIASFFGFGGDDDEEGPGTATSGAIMGQPMNLAPAAAAIAGETVQKTETVERNEVKIVVSSKDQTPVEAALSGKSGGPVSLDTGRLMGSAS